MGRMAQKCKQCGREIYFDGICISCRAENERNEILTLPQEAIDAAIHKICDEIRETEKLDKERHLFTKLLNYRDIDTAEIAKAAFEKRLFYPSEIYKDAPDDVLQAMLSMLKQDDIPSRLAGGLLLCLAIHGGEEVFIPLQSLKSSRENGRKSFTSVLRFTLHTVDGHMTVMAMPYRQILRNATR